MAADPVVSVIIPAYNAQATIARAIEALLVQRGAPSYELIVVDDGSTDDTPLIVARYPQVRCLRQPNAGPANARNRGASEARGAILMFTDADCVPQPEWVARLTLGLGTPGVDVVAGSYGIANPRSWLARVIHAEIIFRHRVLMGEYVRAFGSYNFALRRELFAAAGGFDGRYRRASGEDNDLSYKIVARGGRILFLKDVTVAHHHQESLSRYLREQYRHGFWRVRMYRDHPRMMAGDGYTFWKDIIEIPLAFASILSLLWWPAAVALLFGFLTFEVVFGRIMMGSWRAGLACGTLMWLRAFARAAGALQGALTTAINMISGEKKFEKNLRGTSPMLI